MFLFDFLMRGQARLPAGDQDGPQMSLAQLYDIAEITEGHVTLVDDFDDFDPVYRKSEKFSILNRIMKVNAINKTLTNAEFNKLFDQSKENSR